MNEGFHMIRGFNPNSQAIKESKTNERLLPLTRVSSIDAVGSAVKKAGPGDDVVGFVVGFDKDLWVNGNGKVWVYQSSHMDVA